MDDERKGRTDGFDDLFDDLDRFFAPAEETEGSAPAGPAEGEPRVAPAGPSTEEAPRAPDEDDLLPPGWKPDIEALDVSDRSEDQDASGRGEDDEEGARPPALPPPEGEEVEEP